MLNKISKTRCGSYNPFFFRILVKVVNVNSLPILIHSYGLNSKYFSHLVTSETISGWTYK